MSEARTETVLVVDDEIQIQRLLRVVLEGAGYGVLDASSGIAGVQQTRQWNPAAVILDLALPGMDGIEVLKELRTWYRKPVLILSAAGDEARKVQALDLGADDFVTKPFGAPELLARLRSCLRRYAPQDVEPIVTFGNAKLDLENHALTLDGKVMKLTATEFALLTLFARHLGKVLTHKYLLREVWGEPQADQTQYLRVYVGQLRQKIEVNPSMPRMLLTEPGVGYRLVDPV